MPHDDGDGHSKVMMHHVSENVSMPHDDGDGHSKVMMHDVSENVSSCLMMMEMVTVKL